MQKRAKDMNDRRPLVNIAYEEIYKRIICLEYKPGQALQEKTLTVQLGIGRTPIREALFVLSNEHLVESKPQAGFIVKALTFQSVKAMFKALKLFESGVAQLLINEDHAEHLENMIHASKAVEKAITKKDVYGLVLANNDFHMSFTRCSQNEFLVRAMHEVRCEANRLAYLSFSQEHGTSAVPIDHYQDVNRNHQELIAAVKKRDLQEMERVISEHIQVFQTRIVNYLIL